MNHRLADARPVVQKRAEVKKSYPEDTHPLIPLLDVVWGRRKTRERWEEILRKREGDPLLGSEEDLRQDTFTHVWEKVIVKGKEVRVMISYIQKVVKNYLLDVLRRISRENKNLKGYVYLDVGDVVPFLSPFSEMKVADIVGDMDRLITPGQEWRREVLRDVVHLSGARGEPDPDVVERYSTIGNRSPFRAACAAHGVSKKRQEILLGEIKGWFRERAREHRALRSAVKKR